MFSPTFLLNPICLKMIKRTTRVKYDGEKNKEKKYL